MTQQTFYLREVDGQPEAYKLLERGFNTCRIQRIGDGLQPMEGHGPWTIARDRLEAEFTETGMMVMVHAHMGWSMRGMHRGPGWRNPGKLAEDHKSNEIHRDGCRAYGPEMHR